MAHDLGDDVLTVSRADDPRRNLPAVDALLSNPEVIRSAEGIAPAFVTILAREAVAEARSAIASKKSVPGEEEVVRLLCSKLADLKRIGPRRAINATGVILHTGLGRAPLSDAAQQSVAAAFRYCDLELDMFSGERGERQNHAERLLQILTGAEAAMVVNNNAAAVYLVLNTLAYRKEAIVSRGQLIEIGGSFRLPDIMQRSNAKLVEVGTTNRTRIGDYREAITPRTALLMRAHPSNYRVVGFTESVAIGELAKLGQEKKLTVVEDLGNGLLWDWSEFGLPAEENVRDSLNAGADLVLFSGDKVLGGPQAGIIVGRKSLISRLRKSPLARVLRSDKLTIAALTATLSIYLDPRAAAQRIPVWNMLTTPLDKLTERANRITRALEPKTQWKVLTVEASVSEAGSGTLPAVQLPSIAVSMLPQSLTATVWARRLRQVSLPVVGTVRQDRVWLDMRTISEQDEPDLINSVIEAFGS